MAHLKSETKWTSPLTVTISRVLRWQARL